MDRDKSTWFIQQGVRVVAAGLGAAVAGPLGGALGGFLGDALLGSGTLAKYAEKFGEEGAKKLLDIGADSISEKLKSASPDLAALYRETQVGNLQRFAKPPPTLASSRQAPVRNRRAEYHPGYHPAPHMQRRMSPYLRDSVGHPHSTPPTKRADS